MALKRSMAGAGLTRLAAMVVGTPSMAGAEMIPSPVGMEVTALSMAEQGMTISSGETETTPSMETTAMTTLTPKGGTT
jgi:hypothetical protein